MIYKLLIKGIATYIPGIYQKFSKKTTGGTVSARYCYSVWLRHLEMARSNGLSTKPKTVAELGPGDSIGIGLTALLSGAERYYAFDVVEYTDISRNLEIFDELVSLLKNKEDIPGEAEFPAVKPNLESYEFPSDILPEDHLRKMLNDERLEKIRKSIVNINYKDSYITYKVPWFNFTTLERETVDWVYSQAVLEHVEDLQSTYAKMYSWLKPKGVMSHTIDFKSHGYANEWNGHWTYSDIIWSLIKGNRAYFLNRQPHSTHIELIIDTGFEIICEIVTKLPSKIDRNNLSCRFRNSMSNDDINISGTFIQAIK